MKKKKTGNITSDDDQEYYPKYILESQGAVTISLTIKGDKNNVRLFSGQAPPAPKPGGH